MDINESPSRMAVVVSKKVAQKAFARNKIRRRIRFILKNSEVPENKILVFYAKKGILDCDVKEIERQIRALL